MAKRRPAMPARWSLLGFLLALVSREVTAHTCLPSELGYQCKLPLPCKHINAALHWSVGGQPPRSSDVCRFAIPSNENGTMAAIEALNGRTNAAMVHMALVFHEKHGYLALAVPQQAHQMIPADALVAAMQDGKPYVMNWDLQSKHDDKLNQVDHNYTVSNWGVSHMGDHMVMCFSRQLGAVGKAGIRWSLHDMPINFAVGKAAHLSKHEHKCSLETISLAAVHGDKHEVKEEEKEDKHGEEGHHHHHHDDGDGTAATGTAGQGQEAGQGEGQEEGQGHHHHHHHHHGSETDAQGGGSGHSQGAEGQGEEEEGEAGPVIHGWLMIVSWSLIIPLGMLAPRYRDAVAGWRLLPWGRSDLDHLPLRRASNRWFTVHQVAQWTGTLMFIAGLLVILSHDGWTLYQPPGLIRAHSVIGITLLITLVLHILIALCRPAPDAVHRPTWRSMHVWGARSNVLLAAFNVLMGPLVYYDHTGDTTQVIFMYVAIGAFLALVAVMAVLAKQQQAALVQHGKQSGDGSERDILLSRLDTQKYESVAVADVEQ